MKSFEELLTSSVESHGHLCPGQVVGVRMAMLGCRLVHLENPRHHDQIKKLIVYVEMDRCTADAVAHVTGVRLGRRSLKFMDYGIMASTFVNLESGEAYRVLSTEESRDLFAHRVGGRVGISPEVLKLVTNSRQCRRRRRIRVFVRIQLDEIAHLRLEAGHVGAHRVDCFSEIT